MLRINNLTKDFKSVRAVNNLSFEVKEGRIFGLLGPNGAGKTTTLRIILDIIRPTSGDILFEEKHITLQLKNKIGYLPEERGLYDKSKVKDVILYFGKLKDASNTEISKNLQYWSDKLSVKDLLNKRIETLSKGNQQKIQFICSIIHNPSIIILDEPFSGFDPINQLLIKDIIRELLDSGKLIILSTHLLNLAEQLCSDILLINNGNKILDGSLEEIKSNFGPNTYKVHFSGNGKVLMNYPEVDNLYLFDNSADIILKQNVDPQVFLKKIVNQIDVNEFYHVEPTLDNIFLETVHHIQKRN
jgi:ABC-2 type transport system ATP-binding protein